jgi:outer membrane protein insertion porin family
MVGDLSGRAREPVDRGDPIWYKDMNMKKMLPVLLLAVLPLAAFAQETVERIDIVGNDRVTKETVLYYLSAREGDVYNEDLLRRDFRVLWSTGFFSDVRIDQAEGEKGKVIRIVVTENPVIKSVAYKTGKKVKEDDIVNKLKEKDEYILPYSYYSPSKVQKIKRTIGDLLSEKGLQAAKIDTEVAKKGKNEVDLVFRIDEGPKVRVGEVVFEGRVKLPESALREAMKDNRPHNVMSWIGGKDVFKSNKIPEDLEAIKKRFQEMGYMEATVGEPRTELIDKRTIFFKKQKMMRLVVPVNAGYLYRVGEIKIDGNKSVNGKYLRSLVKLEKGQVYSTQVREKAIEKMGETYRDGGYLYAQIAPVESLDPKHKVVNVTFNVYEGDIAYLHRLEFRGNNYTKDKVIRREMIIREGDRFSLAYFKDSILRIKQLGLVDLEKEPDIKPDAEDPTKIDVQVNVKELQRNNIQFTAGYSGYEGTFIALSYSTVNFLGAGETLEFQVQQGKRIKNYSFGFTEPYLFDMPVSVGFNIYDRKVNYPYLYNQKSRGIDLVIGARLVEYWRANLTYSFQNVNVTLPDNSGTDSSYYQYYAQYYATYMGMYGLGHYNMSSIEPLLYRSTIDSPLTPTRGTQYSLSLKFAGSFLGGEISLIRPRIELSHFQPFIANHVIGIHAEYQSVKSIRGSQIPFWEKFYLGGERSIRGYEIYTIGPRSSTGTLLGGDKSLVVNAEYIIPIGGPLWAILFYDMGNAIPSGQKFSLKGMYTSTGLEARVFVPALRVPFRLIFAYNSPKIYNDESNFAFRFAVGTTF